MEPDAIRKLRQSLKMTQAEFARRLGFQTRGAVCQLEKGSRHAKGPVLALLRMLEEEVHGKRRAH